MASRLRHTVSTKVSFFAFQDIITAVSGILILVVLMLAADLDKASSVASVESNPGLQIVLVERLAEQARVEIEILRLRDSLAAALALPDPRALAAEVESLRSRLQFVQQTLRELEREATGQAAATRQQDTRLGLADLRASLDREKAKTVRLTEQRQSANASMVQLEERVRDAQTKLLQIKAREGQIWLIPDADRSTMEPVLVTVSRSGLVVERFDKPAERASFTAAMALAGIHRQLAGLNKVNQYLVFLVRPSGIDLFEEASRIVREQGFDVGFDAIGENQLVHFGKPTDADWFGAPTNGVTSSPTNLASAPATGTTGEAAKPGAGRPPPAPESWWRRLLRAMGF